MTELLEEGIDVRCEKTLREKYLCDLRELYNGAVADSKYIEAAEILDKIYGLL